MSDVATTYPELLPLVPLPAEVTSFVGRRAELKQIRSQLTQSRLVTLTGFGGVGKTRLATRVAGELRRAFTDGVWFVDLSPVADPAWLAEHIARCLGLQGRSTRAASTTLVEYLQPRAMLLVIDNCEHVIDGVSVLADAVLRSCPRVRLLATSREPLRIPGEAVHPVAPLAVPDPTAAEDGPLQQYEGISLFVERARSVQPTFAITAANRAAIVRVCCKLEGIPLAIELAAGRARAMSPTELDTHLDDRWAMLNRGSRAAPDRQRTMAACVEWSFDLCTEAERDLWADLAVFADGFELDAVQAIHPASDDAPVIDTLLALIDKSIIVASGGVAGTRYRMLPPIRARGLARLRETERLTPRRRRHRDWILDLIADAQANWIGPHQLEWLDRLRREERNIHAAIDFCSADAAEADSGLLITGNLVEFAFVEGQFRITRALLDRLLPLTSEPTSARLLGLRAAVLLGAMQGEVARVAPLVAEVRALAAQLGGTAPSYAAQAAGFVAMFSDEQTDAARFLDEAVTGFTASDNQSQIAFCHALVALAATFLGDLSRAAAAHEACLAVTEPAGESWYRSYSLCIAGLAAWTDGDRDRALALQREGLHLRQRTRDRLGAGLSLEAVAWLVVDSDPERSVTLLAAARNEWDRIETSTAALPGLHVHHEACVAAARRLLGPERYEAAWSRGRTLSEAEALEFALGERVTKPSPSRAERAVGSALTPRELQIARLVQQGMNNRQIADALVISKRTAETHVEHMLTKLGFTSRNQVAAWVTDQDT